MRVDTPTASPRRRLGLRRVLRAGEPGHADAGSAQLLLGRLYLSQQKLGPALRAYEQYLRDVPSAPNAPQVRSVVEKLRRALRKNMESGNSQPPRDGADSRTPSRMML